MSSVFVIVADVLTDESLQVPLVQGNHVIKQVASATLDPTLGDAILPGASTRGLKGNDLHRSYSYWHVQPVFCVSVKDQKARHKIEWEGLSQLLHDPHGT
jgi:hypothetical protein